MRKVFVILFAVVCLTALLLTQAATHQSPTFLDGWFLYLLAIDVTLIVIAMVLIIFMALKLLNARRRGVFGARLSLRFSLIFFASSLLPVILLYALSVSGIYRSVESWFSTPLGNAFEKGEQFGQQVLNSEFARLEKRARALLLALGKRETLPFWVDDFRLFHQLENIHLYDNKGTLVSGALENKGDGLLPNDIMTYVRREGIHRRLNKNNIEIIIVLPTNGYLMKISRALPSGILEGLEEVEHGRIEYDKLKTSRRGLLVSSLLALTMAFLMVFLAIIWGSLWLGQRLARPLTRLAEAATEVGRGNFDRRLKNTVGNDEIARLNLSFNKMIEDLGQSRHQIAERQEALSKTNAYLKNLLESLSSGVLAFNANGRLLQFNTIAADFLNGELHELIGKPLKKWPQSSTLLSKVNAAVIEALKNKTSVECRIVTEDNLTLVMRVRYLKSATGAGALAVVEDITKQIQAEREATWEEASRRFAHEIKNPLTPIQLAAEHLQRKLSPKVENDEKQMLERLVTTITNQVDAMRQMVDNFRLADKISPIGAEEFSFIQLVREIANLYERPLLKLQLVLFKDDKKMTGNAVVLRQMLHNLIGNAADASAEEESPLIKITAKEKDNGILLTIQDNGCGIPEHIGDRAFEPYVTDKPNGTGLGLVVVKRIVEEHGGQIYLENHGDGARATIWLPYHQANGGKQ